MSLPTSNGRTIGFVLMGTMCVFAALLQWKGLLFTAKTAPSMTSVAEYREPDGTIVHKTSVKSHPADVRWYLVVPIGVVFVAGAVLVRSNKSS